MLHVKIQRDFRRSSSHFSSEIDLLQVASIHRYIDHTNISIDATQLGRLVLSRHFDLIIDIAVRTFSRGRSAELICSIRLRGAKLNYLL